LYGYLPAIGTNPHDVVKKSAAVLYPALHAGLTGRPTWPAGPDVLRWQAPHLLGGLFKSCTSFRFSLSRSDLFHITLLVAAW